MALYRAALLVAAGRKADRVARVVVDDRQRMAAALAGKRHPALEVHLPEKVRRLLLEAPSGARAAERRPDPIMPEQNLMCRRARRHLAAVTLQAAHDLARSPRRAIIAHGKHPRFGRRRAAVRAGVRTP